MDSLSDQKPKRSDINFVDVVTWRYLKKLRCGFSTFPSGVMTTFLILQIIVIIATCIYFIAVDKLPSSIGEKTQPIERVMGILWTIGAGFVTTLFPLYVNAYQVEGCKCMGHYGKKYH